MSKRKQHNPDFKARVALEAVRGEKTVAELSSEYGIHPTMINSWKRQLQDNASELFNSKPNKRSDRAKADEAQIKELHAKIGELAVANDFLSRKLKPWDRG